jgi:hypothetical protein
MISKPIKLVKWQLVINVLIYLLYLFFMTVFPVTGQNDTINIKEKKINKNQKSIALFGSEEILNVSIYLDLTAYLKKHAKGDAFDSEMTINFNGTDSIKSKIIIKYRGISRFDICSFPPIQINFKKPLNSDSVKIKKLKLVTHCQSGSITDEYILREYLVYKLYNALTDTSFRVRLLKVNYVDSKGKKKTISKYGIFIEPVELLAKRTNSTVVKSTTLDQKHIFPSIMDRVAIFNYMVSNWDWSITGQHNVDVIKPLSYNDGTLGIAIPYDFDLTGVVNAEYAIPPPNLGIETVRDPIFSGICRSREIYTEDLKKFSDSKEKLYSVVNEFPHLNQRSRKDITNFLDRFFDQLEKPKNLDNLVDVFLRNCKN